MAQHICRETQHICRKAQHICRDAQNICREAQHIHGEAQLIHRETQHICRETQHSLSQYSLSPRKSCSSFLKSISSAQPTQLCYCGVTSFVLYSNVISVARNLRQFCCKEMSTVSRQLHKILAVALYLGSSGTCCTSAGLFIVTTSFKGLNTICDHLATPASFSLLRVHLRVFVCTYLELGYRRNWGRGGGNKWHPKYFIYLRHFFLATVLKMRK